MLRVVTIGLAVLLSATSLAGDARADPVTDQIDEALAAYKRNDLLTAMAALDGASTLLREKRGATFRAALPPPLSGWTAAEAEVSVAGAALLGGGTTVTRAYRKGDQTVTVEFMADSPMLQGFAALLGSPLAAAGGARPVVIGGRRYTFLKEERAYMSVAEKIMVKVSGAEGVGDDVLRAYVQGVNYGLLERAK